ncbi:MAG: hypothetical protein JSV37_06940, partial [Anaerolineaceae bacterium]
MAPNSDNSPSRFRFLMLIAIVILIAVGGFLVVRQLAAKDTNGHVIPATIEITGGAGEGMPSTDGAEDHLVILLSEGSEEPQQAEPITLAAGEPLSEEEIERILARLPALIRDPQEYEDFRLPDELIPPPLTGETIEEIFPPAAAVGPIDVEPGPLEVLRYSPEGEIPIAPFVNVTFNQPMVPLATLEDLAAEDVPVQIEPALTGTWRWLGTKTLNFQYDSDLIDRLPMATEYHVTIPAGIQSAIGGVLAETVEFTFSTPTPTMINHYPYSRDPQPLDLLFFIAQMETN